MTLLYLARAGYGGWVTFTAHLAHQCGLRAVFKQGERVETFARDFGYGLSYQNVSLGAFEVLPDPWIVATDKHHLDAIGRLHQRATIVIHDPNEVHAASLPFLRAACRLIVIRRSVQNWLQATHGIASEFRLHPFHPYPPASRARTSGAVSTSRVDFDKHTELIVEANEMLEKRGASPIEIYGACNRLFVHHKIGDARFEKYYAGTFAKSFDRVSEILAARTFMVDMSAIRHDGGGTQYTFLEAAHNGTAIVINRKWLHGRAPNECDLHEGINCLAADSAEELAHVLTKTKASVLKRITANARKLVARHTRAKWNSI